MTTVRPGHALTPARQIVWSALGWPACEHLDLQVDGTGVVADGVVVGEIDGVATRLRYRVGCDAGWHVQDVSICLHGRQPLTLSRRGDRWYDADGVEWPELAGCTDVDIAVTPFTNTVPIRRLGLDYGESADLRIVYIQPTPELDIAAAAQRYTRLPASGRADYRYESGSFAADLEVDGDGIVVSYPGLWVLQGS